MNVRASLALSACALLLLAARASAVDHYVAVKEAPAADPKDRQFVGKLYARIRAAAIEELRGRYQVMMPDNIELILRKSGKKGQEILAQCGESSCAAQFGEILGADLVIAGSFAELEGTLDLTVEIYDVASANVLGSDSARARSKLELVDKAFDLTQGLLRRAVPRATGPRAGPGVGAFAEPSQASFASGPEDAAVSFESVPEGAVVRLDGQLLCERTPCRRRILAGAHEAVFEKERYAPSTQKLVAGKDGAVRATLAPRFGWISVETSPPGVGVAIDGADAGKAPVAWREADEGTVEVVVADPCFHRDGERVAVKAGERRLVKLAAKPRLAGLKVNAEDAAGNALDVQVRVDGVMAGWAGETLKVSVCARSVEVALGSQKFEAALRLEEGKVTTVAAKLAGSSPDGSFARAEQLLAAGKGAEAGEAFETVARQPGTAKGDVAAALHNAAVAWDRVGDGARAASVRERIVRDHADFGLADLDALQIAGYRSRLGDHAGAAKAYGEALRTWPKSSYRCVALQNLGSELDVANERAAAAERYEAFARDEQCAGQSPELAARALGRAQKLRAEPDAGPRPAAASASSPKRVAVLEFVGAGDEALRRQLAEEARAAAADELRAGGYQVLSRESMAELRGPAAEATCEVEVGRMLGVDAVVSGRLRAIGTSFVLTTKLHDARTGALLSMQDAEADDASALLKKDRSTARALVRGGLLDPASPSSSGKTSHLFLVLAFQGAAEPALREQLADEVRRAGLEALRGRYFVLTLESLAMVIPEFAEAHLPESSSEIDLAQAIGADAVASGEVRKVGGSFVLTLKLFDARKAALVASETVKSGGELALVADARKAAQALVRRLAR